MYQKLSTILFTLAISPIAYTQSDTTKSENPFTFEASYIGDAVSNIDGGIETGASYLGLANIMLEFNTETAGWWKGGSFFVNGANTHGGEPSSSFIGDFQGVSNIAAGDLSYLHELWYSQELGKLSLTIGLQDLNAEFAVSDYGSLFINSSFGIHSTIANNIPSPIFPFTRLGATLKYLITEHFTIQTAVYDGLLDDTQENKNNLDWNLTSKNGTLYVGEIQSAFSLLKKKEGLYKFGVYYHYHPQSASNENIEENQNLEFYFVGDQQLTNRLAAFVQVGLSNSEQNNHNTYIGGGLYYSGFSGKRKTDEIGLALGHSRFKTSINGNETAIELNYKFHLNENIFIQPDVQYIINPSGTEEQLDNAFVGILRCGLNF